METYIKNKGIDITYQSELIPSFIRKQGGLIRPSLRSRTRWTILNAVKNLAHITYVGTN